MKHHTASALAAISLAALLGTSGCKREEKELAPPASALAPAAPITQTALTYAVDSASSKVSFQMDAELEKIAGRAPGSAEGQIFADTKDITKTSGLIKVDLLKLSISHQKRERADKDFGDEKKDEKQNQDMRTWLQISADAPADVREQNRYAEFKIEKIEAPSATDVTTMSGSERRITAQAVGDFRLHGRVSQQKIPVEITWQFAGDTPRNLLIKTTQPFGVDLAAHDVRPRKAFDQLADATLETLGKKVNKVAQVDFEVSARPLTTPASATKGKSSSSP